MGTPEPVLTGDGHEDLLLGTLADGRDYLSSAGAMHAAEADAGFANPNGTCMLELAGRLSARIGVIVATVQTIPRRLAHPGERGYVTVESAHRQGPAARGFCSADVAAVMGGNWLR